MAECVYVCVCGGGGGVGVRAHEHLRMCEIDSKQCYIQRVGIFRDCALLTLISYIQ